MTYVAFLRVVNVGGKGIVSMMAIKEALVALGLADVRTYINSGNVIEHHTGTAIKVLVIDHKTLKKMVDAIPRNWVDDKTMRTSSFCYGRSSTIAGSSTVSRSSPG